MLMASLRKSRMLVPKRNSASSAASLSLLEVFQTLGSFAPKARQYRLGLFLGKRASGFCGCRLVLVALFGLLRCCCVERQGSRAADDGVAKIRKALCSIFSDLCDLLLRLSIDGLALGMSAALPQRRALSPLVAHLLGHVSQEPANADAPRTAREGLVRILEVGAQRGLLMIGVGAILLGLGLLLGKGLLGYMVISEIHGREIRSVGVAEEVTSSLGQPPVSSDSQRSLLSAVPGRTEE